jgi:hypothetical protein
MQACAPCPAGREPTETRRDCRSCTLGYMSDPGATGGLCVACARGTQPTDAAFAWLTIGESGAVRGPTPALR